MSEIDYRPATEIEPPHDVTDWDKQRTLRDSMYEHGWIGRPVLAIAGDRPTALTGSHRIDAAIDTGVLVPVIIITPPIFDGDYAQSELWSALVDGDDDERAVAMMTLVERGELAQTVLDVMLAEIASNDD